MLDRSSAPRRVPDRTGEERVAAIAALRRLRLTRPRSRELLGMPLSTVSAVLPRIGLGKLCRLEPPEPPNRYERSGRASSIHIDVKKLGRIDGIGHRITGSAPASTRAHAGTPAPDDRLGVRPRLRRRRHPARLRRGARRRERRHRRRLPAPRGRLSSPRTGSGRARHDRQRLCLPLDRHALACRALGIRHLRTRPYRPRTNGKAERFIRTLLDGWAYGASTAAAPNAPPPSPAGSTSTITDDHTAPSATNHHSPASPR